MFDNRLLSLSKEKMKYAAARQEVITANIANADTPGVKSKDLLPFDNYISGTSKLALAVTSKQHIPATSFPLNFYSVASRSGIEPKLNGNNINIDAESTKVTKNKLEHKTALTMYSKISKLLLDILEQK